MILPDSLEYIDSVGVGYEQEYETDVIRIGPKLKVGGIGFQNLLFDEFEVSSENPYYISVDGCLMSEDGKELLFVPTKRAGEYHVPKETEIINYYTFEHCDQITDIYLPESLFDLNGVTRKNKEDDTYYYTLHCPEGSETARQLDRMNIPWIPTK